MKTVCELNVHDFADLIKTVRYGYMDGEGVLHFVSDPDFTVENYAFSSPEEVIRNKCGWCWDVANLIVRYCKSRGLRYRCFFMEYLSEELHQTHTQVFTEYEGNWYAFPDNSAPEQFREHRFDDCRACVDAFVAQFIEYLKAVLKEAYREGSLQLKEIICEIPAGISDEEYLCLARGGE